MFIQFTQPAELKLRRIFEKCSAFYIIQWIEIYSFQLKNGGFLFREQEVR